MPEYTVVKTLNNNVILVTDRQTSRELILIGKGIGFGKREGQAVSIPDEDIEKSFVAYNEKDRHAYYQLINQVDSKVIGVSEEIIALAEQQLGLQPQGSPLGRCLRRVKSRLSSNALRDRHSAGRFFCA